MGCQHRRELGDQASDQVHHPAGNIRVASTSASVIAGKGLVSLASTTEVLPVTITGASTLTRPSSDEDCGQTTPRHRLAQAR